MLRKTSATKSKIYKTSFKYVKQILEIKVEVNQRSEELLAL